MTSERVLPILAVVAVLGTAACSRDVPGGQGASVDDAGTDTAVATGPTTAAGSPALGSPEALGDSAAAAGAHAHSDTTKR